MLRCALKNLAKTRLMPLASPWEGLIRLPISNFRKDVVLGGLLSQTLISVSRVPIQGTKSLEDPFEICWSLADSWYNKEGTSTSVLEKMSIEVKKETLTDCAASVLSTSLLLSVLYDKYELESEHRNAVANDVRVLLPYLEKAVTWFCWTGVEPYGDSIKTLLDKIQSWSEFSPEEKSRLLNLKNEIKHLRSVDRDEKIKDARQVLADYNNKKVKNAWENTDSDDIFEREAKVRFWFCFVTYQSCRPNEGTTKNYESRIKNLDDIVSSRRKKLLNSTI